MATQKVLDAAHAGLNACVVHPSGIIGPNDPAIGQTTRTLTQILNGEMPIGMAGSFNMVDVRDLAAGTIAAADKGRKGECYILSNDEVTLKEMCRMLKEDTGCKGCKFYLPLSFAHLAAKQMEKSAAKKGTKPVLTEFAVYNLERNNAFDCSKAMNELGFAPVPTPKHSTTPPPGSKPPARFTEEVHHETCLCDYRRRQRHGPRHGQAGL